MIKTFDVATIRKDFPIFETGIAYLDSANTSQRPRQVTGAMMEYFEKFNSNIHRAAYHIAEEATEHYEGHDNKGATIVLDETVTLEAGDVVDLRQDIQPNYDFYKAGPGYKAIGK